MYQETANLKPSAGKKLEQLLLKWPVIMQFLKFAGIGFLTTAVDFLVLNLISKYLGVNEGLKLGGVNVISFTVAVLHSYFWNRHWSFGDVNQTGIWKSFWRSVLIGFVGVLGIAAAVLGGKVLAPAWYYLIVLGVLAVVEIVIWVRFNLGSLFSQPAHLGHTLLAFIVVSAIGALINSGLVGTLTEYWKIAQNPDLNKNLAKIAATVVSLIWNFTGYKLIVFRK